jgi:hypothetical protein
MLTTRGKRTARARLAADRTIEFSVAGLCSIKRFVIVRDTLVNAVGPRYKVL